MRTDDGHVLERESYWKDVLHPRSLGHKELTEPDLPAPMLKDLTRVPKTSRSATRTIARRDSIARPRRIVRRGSPCGPVPRRNGRYDQDHFGLRRGSLNGTRICRTRAASRPGSQHGDLGIILGRAVAVLHQPADISQAPPRPPPANEIPVDISAVTGNDVTEVFRVTERQGGEVIQRVA